MAIWFWTTSRIIIQQHNGTLKRITPIRLWHVLGVQCIISILTYRPINCLNDLTLIFGNTRKRTISIVD